METPDLDPVTAPITVELSGGAPISRLDGTRELVEWLTDHPAPAIVDLDTITTDVDAVAVADLVVARHENTIVERLTFDREEYLAHPVDRRGEVRLSTIPSLIAYAKRHRTDAAVAYLNPTPGRVSLTVVFDDHEPISVYAPDRAFLDVTNEAAAGDAFVDGRPGWRRHRATASLVTTAALERWLSVNRNLVPQGEFAELVEQGLAEIVGEAGTHLLEVAQTMTGSTSIAWHNAQRLDNGQVQMFYVEEINGVAGAQGQLTIPSTIPLAFAPWLDGPVIEISARFRWRRSGTSLRLGVVLDRIEDLLDQAARGEAARFEAETRIPVLVAVSGAPVVVKPR